MSCSKATFIFDTFLRFRRQLHKTYVREGEFTHEDVIAKLGRYEYDCEKPIYVPSLDETYYTCSYDLNGDKVFPIGVFYGVEKDRHLVTRVIATIGDS